METVTIQINDQDYNMLKATAELKQVTVEEVTQELIHDSLTLSYEKSEKESAERIHKDHDEAQIDKAAKPENQSTTAPEIARDMGITI